MEGGRVGLPSRRESATQKATIGSHRVYLTVGHYADGEPGELFLTVENAGSEIRMLYDVIARCVSMGLQHGIPMERYVAMFLGTKGEIAGPVQHHGRIKLCQSILDYVARELGIRYLGREDLAHVREEGGDAATHL